MAAVFLRHSQPRTFQPRRDVLNELTDEELIKRSTEIILVTALVREALKSDTRGNSALNEELKVITTLRYLATGKMQLCINDNLSVNSPLLALPSKTR